MADTEPSWPPVYLASRCAWAGCEHTANWHRIGVGCSVPLCDCTEFATDTAADKAPEPDDD